MGGRGATGPNDRAGAVRIRRRDRGIENRLMRPEDIARYLKDHPEFFEAYADMIGEISIPHPHGGRAIPISERQIISLREKNKVLEGKLRELVEYGEENDTI